MVAEAGVSTIWTAASARNVESVDAKQRRVFETPQTGIVILLAVAGHVADSGFETAGCIGFSGADGKGRCGPLHEGVGAKGPRVASARRRRVCTDTPVASHALEPIPTKPEVVLISASGAPAALPQQRVRERGDTGGICPTHDVASADFPRVGGKDVEKSFLPSGPAQIADQLPACDPVRRSAQALVALDARAHGRGLASTYGARASDADALMAAAVPAALERARSGTPDISSALRDALEGVWELAAAHGILTRSATDRLGLDQRARAVARMENGTWTYRPWTRSRTVASQWPARVGRRQEGRLYLSLC